jgi:hypothetical protein
MSKKMAPELERLAKVNPTAAGHCLMVLQRSGQLKSDFLAPFLTAKHPAARRAAIRLATPDQLQARLISGGQIQAKVVISPKFSSDSPALRQTPKLEKRFTTLRRIM